MYSNTISRRAVYSHHAAKNTALWDIAPADSRIGGDFSFYTFTNPETGLHINVLNNSTSPGADVIAYNANNASNEQWYHEYAGDGYYYIRNRETSHYLTLRSTLPRTGINIVQDAKLDGTDADRQLWRLLPADAPTETTAPDAPTAVTAPAHTASVKLAWTPSTASDVASYTVLRGEADGTNWNTIARGITTNELTDNTCRPAHSYLYKVVAVDYSLNASQPSDEVGAAPLADKNIVASWQFEGSLKDETANMMDAASTTTPTYQTDAKVGTQAVTLSGSNWLQLPYAVADMDEMTISLWAKWTNTTRTWTRIFDFGNGTDQYMFLTPSNGSNMRFAIKNNGAEQTVDAATKLSGKPVAPHRGDLGSGHGDHLLLTDRPRARRPASPSSRVTSAPYSTTGTQPIQCRPVVRGCAGRRAHLQPRARCHRNSGHHEPAHGHRTVTADDNGKNEPAYAIDGKAVKTTGRGLVITKGKKFIRR